MYDVALALGIEKLYHEDKKRSFQAIGAAVDVEAMQHLMARCWPRRPPSARSGDGGEGAGQKRSMFMDLYAMAARTHMARTAPPRSSSPAWP